MKKLITILLITISLSGFGQKDTIPKNNEPIVSMDQLNKVLTEMRKKMSIEEMPIYQELLKQMQSVINEAIIEWRKRKTK